MDPSINDMAAKRMGQQLLKGSTLLEDCCTTCQMPLMRNTKQKVICITCEVREEFQPQNAIQASSTSSLMENGDLVKRDVSVESLSELPAGPSSVASSSASIFENSKDILEEKLMWATEQLKKSRDVDETTRISYLIKCLLESLNLIHQLKQSS